MIGSKAVNAGVGVFVELFVGNPKLFRAVATALEYCMIAKSCHILN